MRLLVLVGFLGVIVFSLACGPAATPTPTPRENQIIMRNIAFSPSQLTIKVGETVTWTNEDAVPHTVTGADFDSGSMASGQSYSRTFTVPSTYNFHCEFHPTMQGQVVVTP